MTDKFKKRVREHAEKHNMSYQAALQQLTPSDAEGGGLEVFEAQAVLYNGETTTLRLSMIGGLWHPLGEEAPDKFHNANRVVLPDGTVIKDRNGVTTQMVSCPFHADAQASVRVLPGGSFFCFACHAKGNTTDPNKPECFVRDVARLYKMPPSHNDTATESAEEANDTATGSAEEALRAWMAYAEKEANQAMQRQVQLAGCSVAAFGYAKGNNDATPGMYGHSVAFDDVKALYKRHMEMKGLVGALWQLLDDIDTATDMVKYDDKAYRARVERIQKKRWDTGVVTDGYGIYVKDWPSKRKGGWLAGYDPGYPAESHGGAIIDGVGPEIFADSDAPVDD